MTRSTIFAATVGGAALLVAATFAVTPDLSFGSFGSMQARAVPNERAAVSAVLAAARGANPVMCALAARALDHQFNWGDFRPGYDPRGLDGRAVRETLRVTLDVLRDPGLIELLQPALGDADPCLRRIAAPLLGRVRHPDAVQALRRTLREGNPAARESAALGLGYAGDARTVPDLVGTLRDQDADVRVASAWALGQLESRSGLRPLVAALEDQDARVRATSAWALGRIEDPEAVGVLARALRRDQDVDVRRNAAWALGKVN
jgi:HEAT repeat protein